jgi:hypothetical protein
MLLINKLEDLIMLRTFTLTAVFLAVSGVSAFADKYSTDFSKKPRYFSPHGPDTARKAAKYENGVATFTIQPGMVTGDYDVTGGTERAELGRKATKAKYVRQSFSVRTVDGFPNKSRFMVAQIKEGLNVPGGTSPQIAVYLSRGGEVKCNDYTLGTGKKQRQDIRPTRNYGIRMDDGKWHKVIMDLVMSKDNGYCRIVVDGKVLIEKSGHVTYTGGKELVARMGVYRDKLPYPQTVQFDDWSVISSRKIPQSIAARMK